MNLQLTNLQLTCVLHSVFGFFISLGQEAHVGREPWGEEGNGTEQEP